MGSAFGIQIGALSNPATGPSFGGGGPGLFAGLSGPASSGGA